jgi:hypothetical protein
MKNTRLMTGIGSALVVLLVVVFFGWFWSLGTVHAGPPPVIQLEVVKPGVEWRRATEEQWTALTESVVILPGDRVRTSADGEARVLWGDRGYTRVDSASEIVIEETPLDGTLTPGASISVRVESGRVWSRMLKLLDLDSSMEVKTSDVVATVRGTTFGIIKREESEVAVAESVVEVAAPDFSASTMVRDNQWGKFGQGAVMREMRDLRPDDTWAQGHMRKDKEDDVKVFGAMREYMNERGSMPVAPRFLVEASERLHLRTASAEAAPKLAALYAERRMARAMEAKQEGDWKAVAEYAKQAGPAKGALLGRMHVMVALQARQNGIAGLSRERGLRRELSDAKESARAYLDALGIDERIDDAILREEDRTPERLAPIREDLEIFETRITNIEASEDERAGLTKKAEAMRKRLEYALALSQGTPAPLPEDLPAEPPQQGTQIPDPVKRPTPVIKPPTTNPTPTSQPTTPSVYNRLSLLASPSILELGQAARLTLFGITADGRSEDITSRASFISANGTVSGNMFTPNKTGTAVVNATYTDSMGARIASASVTVNPRKAQTAALTGLSISFTGATTLPCNGRSPFKVMATYSDGRTQDVTMLSRFSVSDSKILFVSDGVAQTFCAAQKTSATLTATYTENQVVKSASAVITLDPEPPPSTGGTRGGTRAPYIY